MDINKKIANGIVISGEDFEYIITVRKPNVNTRIIREFWFKGKNKDIRKIFKDKKDFHIKSK